MLRSKLILIDRNVRGNTDTREIGVSSRAGARIVLKGDLRATAERAWSDAILAQFDSGKDEIVAQNGHGHEFVVLYVEGEQEPLQNRRWCK